MAKLSSLLLILLISLSHSEIRKSRRAKHGEDCTSNAGCEEGFVCRTHRCFTHYEAEHLSLLGLEDKNVFSSFLQLNVLFLVNASLSLSL